MLYMIILVWLFISVAWFAINAYFIKPFTGSVWFVACLPFLVGLLYLIGARLASGSWREPPDHSRY